MEYFLINTLTLYQSDIPQYIIQDRNVHFYVLNGALCDMEHVRCWICDNFYKFYNWRWPSRPGILCCLHRWFSYSSTPSEFCGAPFMHFVKKKSSCTMHFIPNQFISYMPLYVNHVLYEEYLLVTGRKIMSHLVNEILNDTKWSFVQSPSNQKTLPPRTSLQYFGISNIYGTYCRQTRYYVSQQNKTIQKRSTCIHVFIDYIFHMDMKLLSYFATCGRFTSSDNVDYIRE